MHDGSGQGDGEGHAGADDSHHPSKLTLHSQSKDANKHGSTSDGSEEVEEDEEEGSRMLQERGCNVGHDRQNCSEEDPGEGAEAVHLKSSSKGTRNVSNRNSHRTIYFSQSVPQGIQCKCQQLLHRRQPGAVEVRRRSRDRFSHEVNL